MTIRRRIDQTAVQSVVEVSPDLSDWTTSATIQHGAAVNHGDGTETVTYRSPLPVTARARQFLRLRVTNP
jgi:hypothetical protein